MAGEANPSHADTNVVRFEKHLRKNLEDILDCMPIAVSWANLETQELIYINKTFTQMFGYILGDHPTVTDWIEKTYINPDHVERAAQMWYPHFGSASMEAIGIDQVEVDVLCKDGSVKTTLLGGMILPQNRWALATFVDITERKKSELQIQKMAMEDALTGLGNRRAFNDALRAGIARADRHRSHNALLLLDLDGFKQLNDTMGHDCGDIALETIAKRILCATRGGDSVYRLGGDEFAIIIENVGGLDVAVQVAERILKCVEVPLAIKDKAANLGVSIGISVYPDDADKDAALIKLADEALYRAKAKGRGRWEH
ncbi:MAG: sensor domain-containing diguanylate cyclase [Gammaproteobacteria bacterium]|nr:MAG: sensor domain-containing diguanylate cyclase [Gammaproteobacteria bacterium]